MRLMILGAAALLLGGCGGETYPVPASQAYTTLAGVGTPEGLYPLPGGLYDVAVRFESLPTENSVQWLFTHEGDDLARIVAKVEPSGDKASNVTVEYVEGSAPDSKWRNGEVRKLLQTAVQQLVVEAVDSKLDNRPFDMALRANINATTTAMSAGSMMKDANSAMDKAMEEQEQRDRERQAEADANPHSKTQPTMDLSKYN